MDSPPSIQAFNKTSIVRQRYLSPERLERFDACELNQWGYRPLEEFHTFLTIQGFDLKTQCITAQILGRWARRLGMKTGSDRKTNFVRKGYSADEVSQIDDLYRGVHLIGMSHYEYERDITWKGKSLNEYLGIQIAA